MDRKPSIQRGSENPLIRKKNPERNIYELTQGDKLNEIKVRKHLNYSDMEKQKVEKATTNSGLRFSARDKQAQTIEDIIRKRVANYQNTHYKGDALKEIKERHMKNIREIITCADARKRVLEQLSPLKGIQVADLHKR